MNFASAVLLSILPVLKSLITELFIVNSNVEGIPQPTQGLEDVDKPTRDKKVTELYPKFEQELKDNILEYGRTLKSLKDDEVLVIQVRLTRCTGCGIPASLEYTVKSSVLKDFNANKITKNAALGKVEITKGAAQ